MGNHTWQRRYEDQDHERDSVDTMQIKVRIAGLDSRDWMTYQAVGSLGTESSSNTHNDQVKDDTVHSCWCRVVVGISECENEEQEDGSSEKFRAEGATV